MKPHAPLISQNHCRNKVNVDVIRKCLAQGNCIPNMNTVPILDPKLQVRFNFADRCTNKNLELKYSSGHEKTYTLWYFVIYNTSKNFVFEQKERSVAVEISDRTEKYQALEPRRLTFLSRSWKMKCSLFALCLQRHRLHFLCLPLHWIALLCLLKGWLWI